MMKRMWINQPSVHQGCHELHGTNVLADWRGEGVDSVRIWFLSGDIVSQLVPRSSLSGGWLTWLSDGWLKKKGDITHEYYK